MKPTKNDILWHIGYERLSVGGWLKPCMSFNEASGLLLDARRRVKDLEDKMIKSSELPPPYSSLGEAIPPKQPCLPKNVGQEQYERDIKHIYEQIVKLNKTMNAIVDHLGLEVMEKVSGDQHPFDNEPYQCVKKKEK